MNMDWEANKLDTLVGVTLLDISCIRIATDLTSVDLKEES